jgi:hypothetical protein
LSSCSEQKANSGKLAVAMARRPELGEEKIWSSEELKEIARNLALLSAQGVREFYERAYRECRISGRDFPPARAVQELVQAWKQLRKWRARG